ARPRAPAPAAPGSRRRPDAMRRMTVPRPLPVPDLGPQPVPGPVPRPVARLLLPAVLPVVVGVLLCAPAAPAGAASAGSLSFTPARGTGASAGTLTPSAPCPRGTNVLGRVYGARFPPEGPGAGAGTPPPP